MRYACFYYSATGNTGRAVDRIKQKLYAAGSTVDVVKIRRGVRAPDPAGYDAVIIAFPVLAFAPPVFVKKFLRALPRGTAPAYVLAVDGGGGGSAAAVAARILKGRGYDIAAVGRATYPENWVQVSQPPEEESAAEIALRGDAQVDAFIDALAAGPRRGDGPDAGPSAIDVAVGFMFGAFGRRLLGKLYYADEDCNACGACVKACPVGAILLGRGERARPFWKLNCEDCNACMNLCPRNAINTSFARLFILLGITIAAAVTGLWAYFALAKPAFAAALAPAPAAVLDVLAVMLIVLLAHFLPAGPFDRYILRFIQRIPGVRRLFALTFTKNYRRYRAPKANA